MATLGTRAAGTLPALDGAAGSFRITPEQYTTVAVSYTHLTLPTKRIV